jgi:hypothetical protein
MRSIDKSSNRLTNEPVSNKTNLVVSSTEFCQALFDESNIGMGLSDGCGHRMMIT